MANPAPPMYRRVTPGNFAAPAPDYPAPPPAEDYKISTTFKTSLDNTTAGKTPVRMLTGKGAFSVSPKLDS
jgi:hypothetical protein